jgi:anthranilate/para-aminobenzoate synthase component I
VSSDKRKRVDAIRASATKTPTLNERQSMPTVKIPLDNLDTTTNTSSKEDTNMSSVPNQSKPTKSSTKSSNGAPPTANADGTMTPAAAKAKKAKKERVRLVSTKDGTFWVRAYKSVIDKHGVPTDPWGVPMVAKAAIAFGISPEERAERKAKKEAEKAAFDALPDAEKVAIVTKRREEKQTAKAQKEKAEYDALVAKLKAQIANGEL